MRKDDFKLFDALMDGLKAAAGVSFFTANQPALGANVAIGVSLAKLLRALVMRGVFLDSDKLHVLTILRCNASSPQDAGLLPVEILAVVQRTKPDADLAWVQQRLDFLKIERIDQGEREVRCFAREGAALLGRGRAVIFSVRFAPVVQDHRARGRQRYSPRADLLVQSILEDVFALRIPGRRAVGLRPKVLDFVGAPELATDEMVNLAAAAVGVRNAPGVVVSAIAVERKDLSLHARRDVAGVLPPCRAADHCLREAGPGAARGFRKIWEIARKSRSRNRKENHNRHPRHASGPPRGASRIPLGQGQVTIRRR
jgi:hypothetical protein